MIGTYSSRHQRVAPAAVRPVLGVGGMRRRNTKIVATASVSNVTAPNMAKSVMHVERRLARRQVQVESVTPSGEHAAAGTASAPPTPTTSRHDHPASTTDGHGAASGSAGGAAPSRAGARPSCAHRVQQPRADQQVAVQRAEHRVIMIARRHQQPPTGPSRRRQNSVGDAWRVLRLAPSPSRGMTR